VTLHARDWLGHGVAILRSSALCLDEQVVVGCPVPNRAVVGRHPYIRPLLSALHQAAPYFVAVVDRRRAWVFRVEGNDIQPVTAFEGSGLRDPSYAGWAGREEYRVRHRAAELARRHYRSTATYLGPLLNADESDLVVGGHETSIVEFVELLPEPIRRHLAGTFVVDPHAMAAPEVRTRSAHARSARRSERERELRRDIGDREAGGQAVSGVVRCADAVNRSLADLLIVGGDETVPGFVCDTCGNLSVEGASCPVCGGRFRAVPDVVDELVARVVHEHGQVEFVGRDEDNSGPWVAARLRRGLSRAGRPLDT
jgi:peptide subunit release factor 1 (eRF1)